MNSNPRSHPAVHSHVDATGTTSTMIVPDTWTIHHNARRFVRSATTGGKPPQRDRQHVPARNRTPLLTGAPMAGPARRPTVSRSNAGHAGVAMIKSPAIGAHPPRQSRSTTSR
jgi:hypothetical protein